MIFSHHSTTYTAEKLYVDSLSCWEKWRRILHWFQTQSKCRMGGI